jgi:hypothetical protein
MQQLLELETEKKASAGAESSPQPAWESRDVGARYDRRSGEVAGRHVAVG